jgi:hypothetical protein
MFNFAGKKSSFLLFLPLLVLYIAICIINFKGYIIGDESRYYQFALNILKGYYSPAAPNINLWNGPGYPLVLVPFILFKTSPQIIVLFNAFAFYLSVVLVHKTLQRLVNHDLALFLALFWGLYFNIYKILPFALTEPFVCLLIATITYCTVVTFKHSYIYAGFALGFLALTKIVFGYILLALLLSLLTMFLVRKKNVYKTGLKVVLIALVTTLPYLAYTYNLTGKVFYWGNSGGMSLYWMSSPYTFDYGDWQSSSLDMFNNPEPISEVIGSKILKLNHSTDIKKINSFPVIKQDSVYKSFALRNIKANPKQFFKNWLSNISRLLFNAPYSYKFQSRTILYDCLLGSLIVFLSVYSSIYTIINWNRLPFSIKFIMLTALLYLSLTTLLSAYSRMFDIIVPFFLIWFAVVIEQSVSIKLVNRGYMKA